MEPSAPGVRGHPGHVYAEDTERHGMQMMLSGERPEVVPVRPTHVN